MKTLIEMWPQITIAVIYAAVLLVSANQHGKINRSPTNFWVNLACAIVIVSLLYAGGFFG